MKITEKDKDGDYITYENANEYIAGQILKKHGCIGCLVALAIIIVIFLLALSWIVSIFS